MNKKHLYEVLMLITVALLSYSCDPIWSSNEKLWFNNTTESSYKIALQIIAPSLGEGDTIFTLKSNTANQFISQWTDGGIGKPPVRTMKIWVYNEMDSTHYLLHNINDIERNFDNFSQFVTINELSNKRSCKYEVIITVKDSLVSLMTKDTALTGSIFNLK